MRAIKNVVLQLFILVVLFLSFSVQSAKVSEQQPIIQSFEYLSSIKSTQYRLFSSTSLKHDYHLFVRLPESFTVNSNRTYPTIYLLDGDITYPLLASYYQYLRFAEDVPELIIVGISYGSNDFKQGNNRGTDFTAPAKSRSHYGGAAAFQAMMKKELFPFIEANFPSDKKKRILFGQSLGGQFVIYNVLTEPSNFWGHIASNPALHRNLDFFLRDHNATSGSTRLFVSRAENNDLRFQQPEAKWLEYWQSKTNKQFELKEQWVRNHNHFSVAPDSFRNGLLWLFENKNKNENKK